MARRIGFKTIEHQGWINEKTTSIQGRIPVNPYPKSSEDYWRFVTGVERFQRGENYQGEKM